MRAIKVCVESRAGLKLQHVLIVVERPNTRKRCIEISHHGFGASLQEGAQRSFGLVKRGADFGAQGSIARESDVRFFSTLTLGDIAHNPGEEALAALDEFHKRDFQWNLFAAFVQARQSHRSPINMLLTCPEVASDSRPMKMTQVFRHQHRERLAEHFVNREAKNLFSGGIDQKDDAFRIDRNDRISGSFGHRLIVPFTLKQRLSGWLIVDESLGSRHGLTPTRFFLEQMIGFFRSERYLTHVEKRCDYSSQREAT